MILFCELKICKLRHSAWNVLLQQKLKLELDNGHYREHGYRNIYIVKRTCKHDVCCQHLTDTHSLVFAAPMRLCFVRI